MEAVNVKRRILFFHYEFPGGGGERVTRDIAHYLQLFKFETYVVTCHKRTNVPSGINVLELPSQHLNSDKNADAIIQLISSLSIDIFIIPGFLLTHLGHIRDRTSCKFVYVLHNLPFWEAIAKLERRKRPQKSLLKTLEWYFLGYPKAVWFKRYKKDCIRNYEKVYNIVDAYVVLCEGYKEELIQTLKLPEKHKVHVISNSEGRVDSVNLNKKKQVLFVGNLIYENKRVDRLLDIWEMIYKKLPDWELVLVGGGKEKEPLQKRASRKHLKRVIFAGGTQDVRPYYQNASVLCLTSTFEGWPLCLTEAQANGVVPIAFNCCAGVQKILSPSGTNGVLVPPFDKVRFASELYDLLTSPDKIERMRDNVLLKSQDYAMDIIGPQWNALLESLLMDCNSK
ncbi:glycosyltransferase [Bacteroides reticulotermitis]|uniref:Glycosyltransferase n=2 Tax=Bacteroides reticulotermitis TaxID=1133319 RepID=W4UP65_9BACE|nr:glycosyltransferase [Bacteroides reticulotermitis]MBB4044043.1 glycosyltransferase involved in cell wall biosynthesis [Bacteroides reticulotermitis]GAE82617.1 glycosyltransferase [Bacteroides reticulotermitis JCM 10512]